MISSVLKRLPFARNYSTDQWSQWWSERKIDWKAHYLDTWNHPHRFMLSSVLRQLDWMSLLEVGSGPGANLANFVRHFPGRQLGGVDINPEAIELAKQTFNGAFLKVGSADDIMMSDSSTDVVLSDMTMIYFGPRRIKKALKEIRRVARKYAIFCEFHSESLWERLLLRVTSGYHAYNYRTLLAKMGFYDINLIKIPPEAWPGEDPKQKLRYIVVAKVPKRK